MPQKKKGLSAKTTKKTSAKKKTTATKKVAKDASPRKVKTRNKKPVEKKPAAKQHKPVKDGERRAARGRLLEHCVLLFYDNERKVFMAETTKVSANVLALEDVDTPQEVAAILNQLIENDETPSRGILGVAELLSSLEQLINVLRERVDAQGKTLSSLEQTTISLTKNADEEEKARQAEREAAKTRRDILRHLSDRLAGVIETNKQTLEKITATKKQFDSNNGH